MHQKNTQKWLILLVIFSVSLGVLPLSAQQLNEPQPELPQISQCGSAETPSYIALLPIQETYDVFIKLGKVDQSAIASLFMQSFADGICKPVGVLAANGKTWQKIGEVAGGIKDLTTLTLNTTAGEGLPSANRPTVMLVSKINPACVPVADCIVDVGSRQGALKGASTLNSQDSLRVVKVQSLAGDSIKRVDYFVDGKAVYTKDKLEKFDTRYVGGGKHKLTSVATYTSKQQVLFSEDIEQSFADEINYIAFTFLQAHRTSLIALASIVGLWVLYSMLLLAARALYKRHMWKQTHLVNEQVKTLPVSSEETPQFHIQQQESEVWWLAKRGGTLVVIIAVFIAGMIFINSFFLQVFTTDGPSMQVTLHTGDKLLTNKFGKTWAKLARNEYLPKRGDVIIFKKQVQSDLFAAIEEKTETTYVVKRVFALPGERIIIKDGKVRVFRSDDKDGFNPEANQKWASNLQISKEDNIDITLGTDELFVIGDNRPESIDSRANGPIKLDDIVGNAVMRITPKPTRL